MKANILVEENLQCSRNRKIDDYQTKGKNRQVYSRKSHLQRKQRIVAIILHETIQHDQ